MKGAVPLKIKRYNDIVFDRDILQECGFEHKLDTWTLVLVPFVNKKPTTERK